MNLLVSRLLMAGTAFAALLSPGTAVAQSSANSPQPRLAPSVNSAGEIAVAPLYSSYGLTPTVDLGAAGSFVILSKSGITDVPSSAVVGNIGTSPITGAADHLTCSEVTGKVYSVDAAGPAPCSLMAPSTLTSAVQDMQTAYANAAGRPPGKTGLGAGNIGGLTLGPGVYKWSTSVTIPSNVTLSGDGWGVWIFQISGNLSIANGKSVLLKGNVQPSKVFWQVAGEVTMGTTSHFEGVVLSKTLIAMDTGASIEGRLYAQTAVTLQKNSVTAP